MPGSVQKHKNSLLMEKGRRSSHSEMHRNEVERLYASLRAGRAKLVAPAGEARVLPNSLYSFLDKVTRLLDQGKPLMIVRNQADLTTVEASGLLGVSRQFLVNLLDKGEIPCHMVGTHRRIYAQDLFQYRAQRDGLRRKVIRELARAEAREGIYGQEPRSVDDE